MRAFPIFALLLVLTLPALRTTLYAQGREPSARAAYQVIVHPDNASDTAACLFLQDAFLKKITMWPGGDVILPADLTPNSSVRRQFTEDVLKRSVDAVKSYWQQRIFSGREVPPPEFNTDDDVVKYVLKHEGAVGYVSANANLQGCKVLTIAW
jgi:ABC-type phosphate transport system substrate-binding protein